MRALFMNRFHGKMEAISGRRFGRVWRSFARFLEIEYQKTSDQPPRRSLCYYLKLHAQNSMVASTVFLVTSTISGLLVCGVNLDASTGIKHKHIRMMFLVLNVEERWWEGLVGLGGRVQEGWGGDWDGRAGCEV